MAIRLAQILALTVQQEIQQHLREREVTEPFLQALQRATVPSPAPQSKSPSPDAGGDPLHDPARHGACHSSLPVPSPAPPEVRLDPSAPGGDPDSSPVAPVPLMPGPSETPPVEASARPQPALHPSPQERRSGR